MKIYAFDRISFAFELLRQESTVHLVWFVKAKIKSFAELEHYGVDLMNARVALELSA